jgi:two-component system, chemotaxis family, protein-glutamate methylesterase/glutaminase
VIDDQVENSDFPRGGMLARGNVGFSPALGLRWLNVCVPARRIHRHRTSVVAHDIIVIGSSAGGVRALKTLFSSLPGNLAAAIFVVLHTAPHHDSRLADVLNLASALPVVSAQDGEPIVHSRAYVAPPDRHLLVAHGHMHLNSGPKENRARPAINPLFRSAALAYGPRVIGVVLTGLLDDGTLGLWEIKRRGGISVVQDPSDAQYFQMPESANRNVEVDYLIPLKEIGPRLVSLVGEGSEPQVDEPRFAMQSEDTRLTCPDCHGPLRRFKYGDIVELKCRVGHAYSPESALVAHDEAEERTLWSAVEMLEEGADFAELLAESMPASANGIRSKAAIKRRLAARLRGEIETTIPSATPTIPAKKV